MLEAFLTNLDVYKRQVEAHGGHIKAVNNEGGGTTFQVDMPMEVRQNE